MKTELNAAYEYITKNNLGINITTLDAGWAYLYLVKDGKRVGRVAFRSNNQTAKTLTEKAVNVRPYTHLGQALSEIQQLASKHV